MGTRLSQFMTFVKMEEIMIYISQSKHSYPNYSIYPLDVYKVFLVTIMLLLPDLLALGDGVNSFQHHV